MKIPQISIVLPTYNQASLLPAALDGILAQTFRDFELVVVNDGSTDSTAQVLAAYRERLPMTVIEQENQKLPRALNAGFAVAQGRYLTWTSSDNVMLPDMLQELVYALDTNRDVGLVYADWVFINQSGERLGVYKTLDYDRHLLLRTNFIHCCFLFRRECMEKIGGYDPDFIYSEDWEYWIRMSRFFAMKHVPQLLYLYRLHSASMTSELVAGTARESIESAEFDARLRRQRPVDWGLSKIKWWWLVHVSRRDPRQEWLRAIRYSSGDHAGDSIA